MTTTPYTLHHGDCLELIKTLPDNSVDTVITDPPYGLSDHAPEDVVACLTAWLAGEPYKPNKKGFMGKSWDAWVPGPEIWREVLRVLKPGGMCLVFAGTRSMDLMSLALRLAGFQLRDSIGYAFDDGGAPLLAWVYGSGMPKSLNVSKAIDKTAGAEREIVGTHHGSGMTKSNVEQGAQQRFVTEWNLYSDEPVTEEAKVWNGWGSGLKPAWEPIIIAMKPLDGTFAENALKWGVAGFNVDGGRITVDDDSYRRNCSGDRGHSENRTRVSEYAMTAGKASDIGRWPANVVHDGSESVTALFPVTGPSKAADRGRGYGDGCFTNNCDYAGTIRGYNDAGGSAARFFYSPKASKSERNAGVENGTNTHPTVKPLLLLEYLARLTATPTGGIVLDPFMGSGTTGVACAKQGRIFIGMEQDARSLEIAEQRIGFAHRQLLHNPRPLPEWVGEVIE